MNNKQKTTIQITSKTRDHLKSLGKKGDSYDQIIKQLITKNGEEN